MKYIDMHVHTSASDGIYTPSEIVEWGVKLGLGGISITDHDTVDGIKEGILASQKYKDFTVIPGIEFSTIYQGEEIHILGYFIDYHNKDIINITQKIKKHRLGRAEKIIEKLKEININIDFSEISHLDNEKTIGRPHIARILLNKGYVNSVQEGFEKYLLKGKPAYVERFKLNTQDAIHIISDAGGTPVLAHPKLIHKNIDIHDFIDMGIKGIEVYHTKHLNLDSQKYLGFANKYHLFVTGGTDYHDSMEKNIPTLGKVSVPYDSIIKMNR